MNRKKKIIQTSIVGISTNILLAIIKYIIGIASNSIAITSDAINNLSDAMSSVITIIGTKLAGKSPDKKHPMGYGRIEYMSGLLVSFLVLYAGVTTLVEAIKKIITPENPSFTTQSIVILAIAVVFKFLLGIYTKKRGQQLHSESLIASGKDSINDSVISISVIVTAIIYVVFSVNIGSYLSVIISGFIIKSGLDLIKESLDKILGSRINKNMSKEIKQTINEDPDVFGAYDLFLDDYGPDEYIGYVHVEVKDTMTAAEIDTMTRRIQAQVYEKYSVVLASVGVYALNTVNKESVAMYEKIKTIVKSHPEVIQYHGFYVNLEKKVMSFDIIIDFKYVDSREKIYDQILKQAQNEYPDYSINLTLDSDVSD